VSLENLHLQERETWKITRSPPNDMELNQEEKVEIDVIIPDSFPEVEFHYEIRLESTGMYKIYPHQRGQVSLIPNKK
jgi:hypothetical protein